MVWRRWEDGVGVRDSDRGCKKVWIWCRRTVSTINDGLGRDRSPCSVEG